MTFDPTINVTNLATIILAIVAFISGWYKFGGRLDMLEYRVKSIEDTLKIIATAIEKQNSNERLLALVDQRVVAVEGIIKTTSQDIYELRRGRGWVTGEHRPGINGEY